MANEIRWYKREPRAFLDGVAGLSCEEGWVYTILLEMIYDANGPIPFKPDVLARRCNMTIKRFNSAFKRLAEYHGKLAVENGLISNPRAIQEIISRNGVISTRKIVGKSGGEKSARKRQQNQQIIQPNGQPNAKQTATNWSTDKDKELENNITTTCVLNPRTRAHAREAQPDGDIAGDLIQPDWKGQPFEYLDAIDGQLAEIFGRAPGNGTFPQWLFDRARVWRWSLCEVWQLADWVRADMFKLANEGREEPGWSYVATVADNILKRKGMWPAEEPQPVSATMQRLAREHVRLMNERTPREQWPDDVIEYENKLRAKLKAEGAL